MHMKRLVQLFCAAALLIVSCESASTDTATADTTEWALKTTEDVAVAARAFMPESKEELEAISANAVLYREEHCSIPFLAAQLNGRDLWQVDVDVKLELTKWVSQDSTETGERTFRLVLDPVTGQLISASCVVDSVYPDRRPPRPLSERERLLSRNLRFSGIAEQQPVVSFIEALNFVKGNPYGAREIYIWHIDYSRHIFKTGEWEEPHPVWWVDLRGITPFVFRSSWIPNMWSVIDTQNGLNILSANMDF